MISYEHDRNCYSDSVLFGGVIALSGLSESVFTLIALLLSWTVTNGGNTAVVTNVERGNGAVMLDFCRHRVSYNIMLMWKTRSFMQELSDLVQIARDGDASVRLSGLNP